MIQLINKHGNTYRLKIYNVECVFMPPDLFIKNLFPVKRCLNNNSFGFYVNREFVSYKQIKIVIKNEQNRYKKNRIQPSTTN